MEAKTLASMLTGHFWTRAWTCWDKTFQSSHSLFHASWALRIPKFRFETILLSESNWLHPITAIMNWGRPPSPQHNAPPPAPPTVSWIAGLARCSAVWGGGQPLRDTRSPGLEGESCVCSSLKTGGYKTLQSLSLSRIQVFFFIQCKKWNQWPSQLLEVLKLTLLFLPLSVCVVLSLSHKHKLNSFCTIMRSTHTKVYIRVHSYWVRLSAS